MPKIKSMNVTQLKQLLEENDLSTEGRKVELVQRLCSYLESDEAELPSNQIATMQTEIKQLKKALQEMTTAMQAMRVTNNNQNTTTTGTSVEIPQSENMQRVDTPVENEPRQELNGANANSTMYETVAPFAPNARSYQYSVNEVVEMIPDFYPTDESSLSVEQFVQVIENSRATFGWDDKVLLLAVGRHFKGVARLWLESSRHLYRTWNELSQAMQSEYGNTLDEAEIGNKMRKAVRNDNEKIIDYCYRMQALGIRYKLSDAAIVRYTREGLKHHELQRSIVAMQITTPRELRKICETYFENLNADRVGKGKQNEFQNANKHSWKPEERGTKGDTKSKASLVTCYNCNEQGHFSTQCPKPPRRKRCKDCQKVHARGEPENCGRNATVRKTTIERQQVRFVKEAVINGSLFAVFIDTGSECNMICQSAAQRLNCNPKPCRSNLTGLWGGKCVATQEIDVRINLDNVIFDATLLIVDDDTLTTDILLGCEIFDNLNATIIDGKFQFTYREPYVKFVYRNLFTPQNDNDLQVGTDNEQHRDRLVNILNQYRNVFSDGIGDVGKTNIMEMDIVVDTTEPISQKPYRIPEPKKPIVKKMIDELLENDIIQKSTSDFSSPMLLVKKKNGSERLVIDYRRLNKYTKKEIFPTPNVEECLQEAKRYKYFVSLDMNSGFYQIPIAESSRKFTAFVTVNGLYEFKRMPFGLKNAPAMFQRLMQAIKEKLPPGMIIYMDDILVGGTSVDDVLEKLKLVLQVLQAENLTLNLQKCVFITDTIEFLGHKLTVQGIEPGSLKTECVRNFPQPTNVTEVRRFLGLSGYFRKFVPLYAQLSEPLRKLLRKDQPFEWTEQQAQAFETLKIKLTSQPVLTGFDVEAEHEIHTDASASGLAGVLMQIRDGVSQPVAFYSRSTTENESNFHGYELEVLAAVETLERFRYYIYGKSIKLITDCSAITTLTEKKEIIPRIARWWLRVQDFDVVFQHRAGERMLHVDALIRAPDSDSRQIDVVDMRIFKVNINNEDWVLSLQLQDSKLQDIVKAIKNNDREFSKDFVLKDERLYRKENGKLLWVVPKSMRWNVVHEGHNNAGPLSVEKTVARLKENLWFARMRNFVKSYIKSCVDCAYNKANGGQNGCEYHYTEIEPVLFHTVHVDHLGPFPKSSKRNEHVLLFVDSFTKFVMIKAVRNTSTKYVLEALDELSGYFGLPKRIVSDRGTAFTSHDFRRYCEANNIYHQLNAVRTTRANGQAERMNRTILSMLTTMTAEDKAWDKKLRDIQWSINSMPSSSTNKSALQLLYNYTPRDILKNKLILALHDYNSITEEDLQQRREEAAKRLNEVKEKAKIRFDQSHRKPEKFGLGDLVLVESEQPSIGHSRKLEPRYKGPFVVTKNLGRDRYVVEDLPKSRRTKRHYTAIFSSDKMKKWCQIFDDEEEEDDADSDDDDEDVC